MGVFGRGYDHEIRDLFSGIPTNHQISGPGIELYPDKGINPYHMA